MEKVILVNKEDTPIGFMEKMEAHEKGLLHRAFSVLIFNSSGELLLQRRALDKYHSAGLWTNTCCSHPRPQEGLQEAAQRRLKEEMGLYADLIPVFSFIYTISFNNGLTENELDHVLFGWTDVLPNVNLNEVAEFKYVSLEDVRVDIKLNPTSYTEWFKILIEKEELKREIKKPSQ